MQQNWAPVVQEKPDSCCGDVTQESVPSLFLYLLSFSWFLHLPLLAAPWQSLAAELPCPCALVCWDLLSGFFVLPVKSHPYVRELCAGFCGALLLSLATGITNGSWWWTACEWAMQLSPAKQTYAQYSLVVAEVSTRIIRISLYNWWLHRGWHGQWWETIVSVAEPFAANLLSTVGALLAGFWAQSTAGCLEQGIEGLFILVFSFGGGMN